MASPPVRYVIAISNYWANTQDLLILDLLLIYLTLNTYSKVNLSKPLLK